ncbi:MAG: NAD(P)-dependent oxidoreductase [Betaproteobacteria bacterium]
MASVLITGGCGFLGAALAARARAAGHSVTSADVLEGADRPLDASDTGAVAALVAELRPAAIVHLAAGLTDAGERDPVATTRLNALGTAAIFAAAEAARTERVIYATSISAVGPTRGPVGDDTRLDPGNVYGATKAFCEHLARAMSARPDAPCYLGLRFGYVYGPGRVRGWRDVQMIVERVRAGERHLVYPDYPDPLDWTWIDDAAEVLLCALERPLPRNAVANVVGDKRHVRDAIAHLQSRFPDLTVEPIATRTPPAAWSLVNDSLQGLLGYVPTTTLEQGIDRMLAA